MLNHQLLALFALSFVSGCSLGIFNPMSSLLMKSHGVTELWIGLHSTVYFLMVALGTVVIPLFSSRLDVKTIIVIGLMVTAVSAVMLPFFETLTPWFVCRLLMGLGVSFYMVSGQTMLNFLVNDSDRSIKNGLYTLVFAVGFGLGPIIGSYLFNINEHYAFATGACILLVAMITTVVYLPNYRFNVKADSSHNAKGIYATLLAVCAYGFAEATLVSLLPLFLLDIGSTVTQIGFSFFAFVLGSLVMTLPIMKWADNTKIDDVLNKVMVFGMIMIVALSMQNSFGFILLLLSFLCGSSIGIIYPLAMAHIGDELNKNDLSAGMKSFTFYFGMGCALGPIISASVMQFTGNRNLFIPTILMLLLAIICSVTQSSHLIKYK